MYLDIKNINIFRDMEGTYRTTNTGINTNTLKKRHNKSTEDYSYNIDDVELLYLDDDFESEEEIMENNTVEDVDFELDIVKDCFNAITKYGKKGYLFSYNQVKSFKEYAVSKKYDPDDFEYKLAEEVIYVSKSNNS